MMLYIIIEFLMFKGVFVFRREGVSLPVVMRMLCAFLGFGWFFQILCSLGAQ